MKGSILIMNGQQHHQCPLLVPVDCSSIIPLPSCLYSITHSSSIILHYLCNCYYRGGADGPATPAMAAPLLRNGVWSIQCPRGKLQLPLYRYGCSSSSTARSSKTAEDLLPGFPHQPELFPFLKEAFGKK